MKILFSAVQRGSRAFQPFSSVFAIFSWFSLVNPVFPFIYRAFAGFCSFSAFLPLKRKMPLFIGHFACFVGVCASSCLNPRKTSVFPLLKPDFAFFTLLLPFSRFLRSKPPKVLCFGLFEPLFTLFSFFCFFQGKSRGFPLFSLI